MANFVVVANDKIRDPVARFEDLMKRFLKQTQESELLATIKAHQEFTPISLIKHRKRREILRKIHLAKLKRIKEKD